MTSADFTTRPFNDFDVIIFAIFIALFMVFGIIANLIAIVVIATSKKLKSIFHYFILSLCVSDTISALISWINLYRRTWGFNNFKLPTILCKSYWALDIWTSYSTALHIVSFALLRLISVQWPPKLKSLLKVYPSGLVWILSMWMVTFGLGAVPFAIMTGIEIKNRSLSRPDSKWPFCTQEFDWYPFYSIYTLITYPLFIYLPIIGTTVLSSAIIAILVKRRKTMKSYLRGPLSKRRGRRDRNAVIQLILIVTSFIIGYLPFTVYEFYSSQSENIGYEKWWVDWHFGTAQYMCLRLSECLNPIFYNASSRTMRNETKKFLTETFLRKRSPQVATISAISFPTETRDFRENRETLDTR